MIRRIAIALGLLVVPVCAVTTSHWVHNTEADFKAGTSEGVVSSNLGELRLSRAVKTLLGQDARVSSVYALAEGSDGTIYAATGPQGVLLSVKDGKVSTAAELGDTVNLLSLVCDHGKLFIGTGGEKGQVFEMDRPGEKPRSIFSADGVQYVWAMTRAADGTLYAATGPNGQLFQINPDGSSKQLFKCEENNLLSMVSDGKQTLYVGTDPQGLVYRIDRKTGDAFILYDAPEDEISALALDEQGNLYAGTAEAGEPGRMVAQEAGPEHAGHPERNASGPPLPSSPPTSPKPPQLPPSGPGEPSPIPKEKPPVLKKIAPPTGAPAAAPQMVKPADGSAAGSAGGLGGELATKPKMTLTSAPAKPMEDPGDPGAPDQPEPQPGAPDQPGNGPANGGDNGQGDQTPMPANDEQKQGPSGNAIYRITPDGFVTEIFRQPITVLSLLEQHGTLLAGTGNDGMVYEIDPAAEETTVLAKVDSKAVMALMAAHNGKTWMGLANAGEIASMEAGYADHGTYTSPPLDAKQVSRFGKLTLRGSLPAKTTLTVATRSGNVADAANSGWSKWTEEAPAAEYVAVKAPSARFLQYRLTFASTDATATPVVSEVGVAYQMPNLPPEVKSVKAANPGAAPKQNASDTDNSAPQQQASSAAPTPSPTRTITWDASDPNGDALKFSLYYRSAGGGPWILLKDKITDTSYDWNTRNVADGRYEVKVVASDEAANPLGEGRTTSRVSEVVEIDNTPPELGDLKVTPGAGQAKLEFKVVDRTSTVAGLAYAVDSADDWQAVLPVDNIADSPEEAYAFTVGGMTAGLHQITLRATDAHGNAGFTTVPVTVAAPSK